MDAAVERHCSELVARERSGHTAVVEDNLLYVWGGYVSIADTEVFLPNDEIWTYDLERGGVTFQGACFKGHDKCLGPGPLLVSKKFLKENLLNVEMSSMSGEVPPPMSGICGCSLNGHMYIFGGCDDNGQTNQLYYVSLLDGKYIWRKVTHKTGSLPSPRDKLSCWIYKGRIIYFGGYGHKLRRDVDTTNSSFVLDEASWVEDVFWGWNNEVHTFDSTDTSWSKPQTRGHAPAPRAAHASATLGHKGYVCGGRVMETRTSDIHCLDLESWTWSEIVPVSTVPVGRSWHTLTAVSDNALFLFGGLSVVCNPMSDGWLLDVEKKKWREVEHPYKNKPRLWHSACPGKDSDVIVFGGSCDYILLVDTGHCNDALIFQMQPYPLSRICEDYIAKNVKTCKMLQNQLPLLPPKLLQAVQRRMSFYRPSKKNSISSMHILNTE